MNKIIKKVLEKINKNGYEAYVIGGFVRDYLLGIKSNDIDICTNADEVSLKEIFKKSKSNPYGGISFQIGKFNFDITRYRKELNYENRKPINIEFINTLEDDLKRRDFTINAIAMDMNENIIDLYNGKDDLKNKIIRIIGDAKLKFNEDPLRILRAIRFATILDFNIDKETLDSINEYSSLTKSLSSEKIRYELEKILLSKNYQRGLDLLKETNTIKYIGINYDNVKYVNNIYGMWAQLNTNKIIFSNSEKKQISDINKILLKKDITNFELFNYGLSSSLIAGKILGISSYKVKKMYYNLPIKNINDIKISANEIIKILNISPCKKISDIINNIKILILNEKLKNNKKDIINYLRELHDEKR